MLEKDKKHVVVIGGGTGTYTLLQGLKVHADSVHITKIVSMADSGGATGRLRDQFGQLPVGDARMGLAALASDTAGDAHLLRELLQYRFHKGNDLNGHNFGNLLLVALTEILGNEVEAIKAASRLLRLRGEVVPVTANNIHLVARYENGRSVVGEHEIDDPPPEFENLRIAELSTTTPAYVTASADRAIREADLIIIGPGDLYASLLANLVIKGVPEAIRDSSGKLVYIANLMSRPGQTRGMKMSDYLSELERYIGQRPDVAVINNTPLPEEALKRYADDGDFPVEDDLTNGIEIIRNDFLMPELIESTPGDALKRALIRHDSKKLADAIIDLL